MTPLGSTLHSFLAGCSTCPDRCLTSLVELSTCSIFLLPALSANGDKSHLQLSLHWPLLAGRDPPRSSVRLELQSDCLLWSAPLLFSDSRLLDGLIQAQFPPLTLLDHSPSCSRHCRVLICSWACLHPCLYVCLRTFLARLRVLSSRSLRVSRQMKHSQPCHNPCAF